MKYELVKSISKEVDGHTVYRIRALKEFITIHKPVKKGDIGGWIESEDNLSQEGYCWVFDECTMYENAYRAGNSVGYEHSQQYGESRQFGESRQSGNSKQFGNSQQYGSSKQCEYSQQYEDSRQFGDSHQYGNSEQCGNSRQGGDCQHSKGIHKGDWTTGVLENFHEFTNIGALKRIVTYCNGVININSCFIGTVDELKEKVDEKYRGQGNYYDVIKAIKKLRQANK